MSDFADTVTAPSETCPACGTRRGTVFYEASGVPAHQVRLVSTHESALSAPCADIHLAFCPSCTFVWNAAFDPHLMQYEEAYESTQAVSPTFNRFHARLARDLVERFGLVGKEILEIGCGQGEFLGLMCDLGVARATGFDEVVRAAIPDPRIRLIKDFYCEAYADLRPDMVVTKMTMEHIPDPGRFLSMLRRTLGDRSEIVVVAMIPEIARILRLRAFWDVYYEHCAYFSPASLAVAFRTADFQVEDVWLDYDDQYVLIAARPGLKDAAPLPIETRLRPTMESVQAFGEGVALDIVRWRQWLAARRRDGRRTVVWGGGSKGVAFLTTLGASDEIAAAVDINPRRHGTFIAGSGHPIVGPDALTEIRPDLVIVMSPIYAQEIEAELRGRGLHPQIVSVESPFDRPLQPPVR